MGRGYHWRVHPPLLGAHQRTHYQAATGRFHLQMSFTRSLTQGDTRPRPWSTLLRKDPREHRTAVPCALWGTHHTISHQGSLCKARQHVGGVMLVVRHAGQAGVKRHHDEGELEEGTEQAGSFPRESGLQIELWRGEENKKVALI